MGWIGWWAVRWLGWPSLWVVQFIVVLLRYVFGYGSIFVQNPLSICTGFYLCWGLPIPCFQGACTGWYFLPRCQPAQKSYCWFNRGRNLPIASHNRNFLFFMALCHAILGNGWGIEGNQRYSPRISVKNHYSDFLYPVRTSRHFHGPTCYAYPCRFSRQPLSSYQ